jgi:hypothetical protein
MDRFITIAGMSIAAMWLTLLAVVTLAQRF